MNELEFSYFADFLYEFLNQSRVCFCQIRSRRYSESEAKKLESFVKLMYKNAISGHSPTMLCGCEYVSCIILDKLSINTREYLISTFTYITLY